MQFAFIIVFITIIFHQTNSLGIKSKRLSGHDMVDYINKNQKLWKAENYERWQSMSDKQMKRYFGALKMDESEKQRMMKPKSHLNVEIPESFDAREKWPNCFSIKTIRDQSACGSCWAISAAEAISDRICVATNGSKQVTISTRDVLSCCMNCGIGCGGGYPNMAWQYWVNSGMVTGTDYITNSGCQPYPFPPCGGGLIQCPDSDYPTPECEKKCSPGYQKSYDEDKHFGKRYYFVNSAEEEIQKEIMQNGPVQASFEVYEDFLYYKKGIYEYTTGELAGRHAIKIIGWGVENGTKYWLIANSWNDSWGENGFFRFIRGKNNCGIEDNILGGEPNE